MSLAGTWKHVRDENFSEYLKAMGTGTIKRAVIEKVHPDVIIQVDGDSYDIKTVTTLSTQENKFTLGVPFETDYKGVIDGMLKCVASLEDGKLVVDATPVTADVPPLKNSRYIEGEEMVQELSCKGVTAKRYFKRK